MGRFSGLAAEAFLFRGRARRPATNDAEQDPLPTAGICPIMAFAHEAGVRAVSIRSFPRRPRPHRKLTVCVLSPSKTGARATQGDAFMSKMVECAKVDPSSGCQHVIRGETEEEVIEMACDHARDHGIREVTPELVERIRDCICDA